MAIQKIKKSKLSWVLSDTYIAVFDKWQATIYTRYSSCGVKGLGQMRTLVLNSKPAELNSWSDVLDLAMKNNLVGHGTRIRDEWLKD